MNKALLALVCGSVLVVAGCGGSDKTAGGDKTAERKAACTKVFDALTNLQRIGKEVGLNVRKPANDRKVGAAVAAVRAPVEELQKVTTDQQRQQLEGLKHQLVLSEKLFAALAVHDTPAVEKYDREAGTSLDTSKLTAICKASS
jgi:hypothetical protein